jgi:hypothetical protein
MRASAFIVAMALVALPTVARRWPAVEPTVEVFKVQAVNPGGVREGTCFVVHPGEYDGVAWFVTSARLFEDDHTARARILTAGHDVEVASHDIVLPLENNRDMAILKARIAGVSLKAVPLVFEQTHAGTPFVVRGFDAAGALTIVPQQVALATTRSLRAGRLMPGLVGCQGAPAMIEAGAFGIVSDCAPGQMPEITPMIVARSFLLRTLPHVRE